MGYFLISEAETAVSAQSLASPKTHTPLPRLQERGLRYYSTELSRWISRDPIGEKGGRHLYGFVLNRPVVRFDSLGLCSMGVGYSGGEILKTKEECGEKCGYRAGTTKPVPACAICNYKLDAQCICVKKNEWKLTATVSGGCTTYVASGKLDVNWDPPDDGVSALAHERCHCEDCRNEATAACTSYSASYPENKIYSSQEACLVDQAAMLLDWAARKLVGILDQHAGDKWKKGGRCYATGDFP